MQYLDRGDFRSSVLGFGCGAVLGRIGRADSLRAMNAAWDAGINLFDVARSYGYGEAEGLLGEFLAGKRDRAVISTKFGIWPERQGGWKQALKPVVRGVLRVLPGARGLVRRGAAGQMTPGQFTVPVLRASLEESLRRLRTEYVDVLFLHSAPASVMAQDDLMAEMERVVEEGKVRLAGLSAEAEVVGRALKTGPPVLRAMQFAANVFDLEVTRFAREDTTGRLFVANHPFGGVTRVEESKARLRSMAADPALPPDLREKLRDADKQALAEVVFGVILRGTGIHAVVPSMMNVENLRINVRAVESSRFTDGEIALVRERFLAS
jgi:aryl-alcohol dehydrogenase-like predicted oxidoreductase